MRLDRFFTSAALLSRTECAKAARAGLITVDGAVVKDPSKQINENESVITYKGQRVFYKKYTYIMLNKPSGCVCSNDEPGEHTVFEYIGDDAAKKGLFVCGRLDKDTTGLVIITNDGASAHNALSPKRHVEKEYAFTLADPANERDLDALRSGVTLADGDTTLPCGIEMKDERSGVIIISEGKYHQIKRMFASVGNKIVKLERTKFGGIPLDPGLLPGEWRYLTPDEEKEFMSPDKIKS